MKRRFLVLGNGGFGTALALHLSSLGHEVRLWGNDAAYTQVIATTRTNPRYLQGFEVPAAIEVGSDLVALARDAERVLAVVPTQHLRSVATRFASALAGKVIVSCSKGLEEATARLPSEILADCIEDPQLFVLAGADRATLEALQAEVSGPNLRIYRSPDRLGAELGAALKNVIAIAAGIGDGLGLGDNAKSALLTRGLAEIARFGVALGADRETFYGLAGLGDLITTSVSPHGRNRRLGEAIGRGAALDEVLARTQQVAEGVWTCRAVLRQAMELGVAMPITEAVAAVLFDGKDPRQATTELMTRLLREEAEAQDA